MTIWKYIIGTGPGQESIIMPAGAKLLCIQRQDTDICLWAIVDPKAPKVKRRIIAHGTGCELHQRATSGQYIGTYQMADGMFIWHVFDGGELPISVKGAPLQ